MNVRNTLVIAGWCRSLPWSCCCKQVEEKHVAPTKSARPACGQP